MYQKKSRIQTFLLLALDCLSILISLVTANYIRNGHLFISDNERMDFSILLVACLLVFLAMNLLQDTNRNLFLRGPLHELLHVTQSNLLMFAGAAVILYLLGLLDAYSRVVFFLFLLLDTGLTFLIHQLFKRFLPDMYRLAGERRKLLLVADEGKAEEMIHSFFAMKDFSYELTGVCLLRKTAEEQGEQVETLEGVPIVADQDNLTEYCRSASLDEVMIAVGGEMRTEILPVMECLAEMGITVHYQIPVPELQSATQKLLSPFGRHYMITYANRIAPIGQILLKRMLDILGALAGCFLLLILTVIVGPLIKLESPGTVFFGQKRVGRNGRVFQMYKFRSMYADAEERKKELMAQNEMNGLMFKMENDPRITKVGRFLRKTSLDEFPQFLNILKGDMSLVGTRPPTLDEFAQYSPYHKKRLSFRPGLTGMWQVSGRSDITDFEEIVRLDVEYIDHWSFWLDVKILLKTVLSVFAGSGAR